MQNKINPIGKLSAIALVSILHYTQATAQNVGINTIAPDASSILDITHTTRGLLIPRIVLTATNVAAPIVAPATSLLVYNTNTTVGVNGVKPGYYYWDGLQWASLSTPPPTTNTLSTSGNIITSTVDGVVDTTLAVNTVSNTSTANNLTTTVNGVTGTAAPIVNTVSNTLTGTNLTTTVNGVAGTAINLSGIVPATTNTLSTSGNTITSTVDGVVATSSAVTSVSNTSTANNLTTTVNGVAGTAVPMVNSLSNTYNTTTGAFNTTVNGIAGANVTLPTPQSIKDSVTSNAWLLKGNAGTNAAVNFLGTTDNASLRIRTNNTEQMIVDSTGLIGMGTKAPQTSLQIADTTSRAMHFFNAGGLGPPYGFNISTGGIFKDPSAATKIVKKFKGLNTSGFSMINLGVEGSIYFANKSGIANTYEEFTWQPSMTITNTGNVGIGTTAPTALLQLDKTVNADADIRIWNGDAIGNSARELILLGQANGNKYSYLAHHNDGYNNASYPNVKGASTLLSSGGDVYVDIGGTTSEFKIGTSSVATNFMTILGSNGNVGIGTAAPVSKLMVTDRFDGNYSAGIGVYSSLKGITAYDNTDFIGLSTEDMDGNLSTPNDASALIYWGDDGNEPLNFKFLQYSSATSVIPKTVMTLLPTGNVGIGTTAPTAKLHVNGEVMFVNGQGASFGSNYAQRDFDIAQNNTCTNRAFTIHSGSNGGSAFGNIIVDFYGNNGAGTHIPGFTMLKNCNVGIGTTAPSEKLHVVGNILASGTITPSDARFKENINTLTGALNNVLKLRGVTYNMKEAFKDKGFGTGTQIGVIAQEVEAVYPALINTSTDGYKGVDYSKFTPILIEAIKEQQAQIEALRATNKAQEEQLKSMHLFNKNQNEQLHHLMERVSAMEKK